jgi:DNA repair and recombination protein RAD54B
MHTCASRRVKAAKRVSVTILMPPFLNPLPPDGPRTEKRKSHELGQCEISSNKKQATGATLPKASGSSTQYWMVQWYAFPEVSQAMVGRDKCQRRAPQSKKHKTWEGDGVLVVTKPKGVLIDLEGRVYALYF